MNADELREVRFRVIVNGYDAPPVDNLLRRIAVELAAGRPAGPLIAGGRFLKRARAYAGG